MWGHESEDGTKACTPPANATAPSAASGPVELEGAG
jgi:hypothetical protein